MGAHRSGTTFLYELLASALPVAALSVYHTVFFDELLYRRAYGLEEQGRDAITGYFQEAGVRTRQFDEVAVSPDTLEEYGFVLRRRAGTAHLEPKSSGVFMELCRKLSYVQGGRSTVLLKNPWDAARAPAIRQLLPGARFVFIHRDPLRIFDSQVRLSCTLAQAEHPLMQLLLTGIAGDRAAYWSLRKLYQALGAARFRRLSAALVERRAVRDLTGVRSSLTEMPSGSVCEVEYEELVARPEATASVVGDFLALPPLPGVQLPPSRPREVEPLPEVESRSARFLAKLAAAQPRSGRT